MEKEILGSIKQEYTPQKFSSLEEELAFLRKKVADQERKISISPQKENTATKEEIISEQILKYKEVPSQEILTETYQTKEKEKNKITLDLAPEEHDKKMEELLGILEEKGIKNTLDVIEKLNNAHLSDDFHRILVQFIKTGYPIQGIKEIPILFKALNMTLYEVTLPEVEEKEGQKTTLKELLSSMEQFYAGMLSISNEKGEKVSNYFTIEIAISQNSDDIVFYSAIPDSKKDLFEKQVLSIFNNAKIKESKDDYNIFGENNYSAGSYVSLYKNAIFPIKTYENFDYDPINILLNSFSKLKTKEEGASIQIIFNPTNDSYLEKYRKAMDDIQKGIPVKDATNIPESILGDFAKGIGDILFSGSSKKDDKKPEIVDQTAIENIKNKISSPILKTNIRILSSAETEERAKEIISDLASAFNQFENTQSNRFLFKELKGSDLKEMIKYFSFRIFSDKNNVPMNIKELTTIMHFPTSEIKTSPQLKQAKAGSAPAMTSSTEGILLGINRHRNTEKKIYFDEEDRLRHFYVIGQTGTGKTTILKNMITQDILNGDGVCMIDPHGSDIVDILSIVPKERWKDVIYFDPGYTARPMGLNMLEYDPNYPEQKTFVVNEMLSIFNKLFDMKTAGGPMFEQYFRNSALLVMEHPESGATLLEIGRVLTDEKFRALKLSHCKNPIITQFWESAQQTTGEQGLANFVPYITNKFDVFLSNEIMRPIVAQEKSSFNFREIMDTKKIFLVNLSKGRLGDINSSLIGLVLVGKILMAALSRVDSLGKNLPPFYLYIDEFQNITTDSISTILSEARKYKLSLNIAHQFIAQLEEKIKKSVFGNVGSIAAFRVGSEDAEFLAKQYEPIFTARDIMNLDNRNAYMKMLEHGVPIKPFNMETIAPMKGNKEIVDDLKQLSYLSYGRDRQLIEDEILSKYKKKEEFDLDIDEIL